MKRLGQWVSCNTRSKKPRLIAIEKQSKYVYATSMKNYFFKDTSVDFLKLARSRSPSRFGKYPRTWRMQQGIDFEKNIVESLRQFCKNLHSTGFSSYSKESYLETLRLMQNGVEIIHSGCLRNKKLKVYGIADLLIRSDYFEKYFGDLDIPSTESNFPHKHYYIVVEIKHRLFDIDSKTGLLKNQEDILAYKNQLYVYNKCVEEMQSVFPRKAYFIGKFYRKNGKIYDKFQRNQLPFVFFEKERDVVQTKFENALNWVKTVNNNWFVWDITPPSVNELYPNMKSKYNEEFYAEKFRVAEHIGEITLLMYCGISQREKAFSKGVYSWKDPSLNSDVLGFKPGAKVYGIIDRMIKINRGDQPEKVIDYKRKIHLSLDDSHAAIDIETFSDRIYLLGIYHRGGYRSFFADTLDIESERKILNEAAEYISTNKISGLYHHYNYDKREIMSRVKGWNTVFDRIEWIDTWRVFLENELVVKGLYDLKLKNLWKAMKSHGMLTTSCLAENCKNGEDSLYLAHRYYNQAEGAARESLLLYNEFDCRVIWDILSYLKNT
jgi:hypothetical protein